MSGIEAVLKPAVMHMYQYFFTVAWCFRSFRKNDTPLLGELYGNKKAEMNHSEHQFVRRPMANAIDLAEIRIDSCTFEADKTFQ